MLQLCRSRYCITLPLRRELCPPQRRSAPDRLWAALRLARIQEIRRSCCGDGGTMLAPSDSLIAVRSEEAIDKTMRDLCAWHHAETHGAMDEASLTRYVRTMLCWARRLHVSTTLSFPYHAFLLRWVRSIEIWMCDVADMCRIDVMPRTGLLLLVALRSLRSMDKFLLAAPPCYLRSKLELQAYRYLLSSGQMAASIDFLNLSFSPDEGDSLLNSMSEARKCPACTTFIDESERIASIGRQEGTPLPLLSNRGSPPPVHAPQLLGTLIAPFGENRSPYVWPRHQGVLAMHTSQDAREVDAAMTFIALGH